MTGACERAKVPSGSGSHFGGDPSRAAEMMSALSIQGVARRFTLRSQIELCGRLRSDAAPSASLRRGTNHVSRLNPGSSPAPRRSRGERMRAAALALALACPVLVALAPPTPAHAQDASGFGDVAPGEREGVVRGAGRPNGDRLLPQHRRRQHEHGRGGPVGRAIAVGNDAHGDGVPHALLQLRADAAAWGGTRNDARVPSRGAVRKGDSDAVRRLQLAAVGQRPGRCTPSEVGDDPRQ